MALQMEENEFWKRERIAFLGLSSLKGVGFWTLHKIKERAGSFSEALRDSHAFGLEGYIESLVTDSVDIHAAKELVWRQGISVSKKLFEKGISLIFREERCFPSKLKIIDDAPWWIFVEGSLSALESKACAIVGSRKATEDGAFITSMLVASLAGKDITTVSGLAQGIDQIVHLDSIRFKIKTVAVLGTGILNNYPKDSDKIRHLIIQSGGAVVSEYLPDQSYSAENFVRRNRLQAALGDVLIPAEWAIKSGTAHTVKYASKYGKKIINVYLPFARQGRPEIAFSKAEYGALSFEIPQQLSELHAELDQVAGVVFRSTDDSGEDLAESSSSNFSEDGQFKLDI